MMNYKVCVHIFSNCKKYAGITSQITNISPLNIGKCCNKKTAGKLHWEFYKEMI